MEVGMVGLGRMGTNMTRRLLRAGHQCVVYDLEPQAAEALAKEKDIQRARALNEGKPEKMVDKIVEGRLQKYYEEVCLYEQPFIKENTTIVHDLIKAKIAKLGENISVSRFVRFKVGDMAVIEETAETSAPAE